MTAQTQPPSPMATPVPWNLVAADYTTDVVPQFERYADRALRMAQLQRSASVVDVACGPGTLALLAADHCVDVAALDFSEAMIAQLHQRLGQDDVRNVEPVVGDGQALPYADGQFDAGFSMFGLMFFPDRHRGFCELKRVVKPGGKVVVSSWMPLDKVPAMAAIFGALANQMPPSNAPPPQFPLVTEQAYRDEMGAAGYLDVQVEQATFSLEAPDTATLWRGMQKTFAPAALMRARMGPMAWPATSAAILADITAAIGSGPQSVAMPAWLAMGTVP